MDSPNQKMVGIVGLYDDPHALLRAAEHVRDAGFSQWDCHMLQAPTSEPILLDTEYGFGLAKVSSFLTT